jgi:hypothetical protein
MSRYVIQIWLRRFALVVIGEYVAAGVTWSLLRAALPTVLVFVALIRLFSEDYWSLHRSGRCPCPGVWCRCRRGFGWS